MKPLLSASRALSRAGFTPVMAEYASWLDAVDRHAAAEGYSFGGGVALGSYDCVLHPWLHGRRLEDLVQWARS